MQELLKNENQSLILYKWLLQVQAFTPLPRRSQTCVHLSINSGRSHGIGRLNILCWHIAYACTLWSIHFIKPSFDLICFCSCTFKFTIWWCQTIHTSQQTIISGQPWFGKYVELKWREVPARSHLRMVVWLAMNSFYSPSPRFSPWWGHL